MSYTPKKYWTVTIPYTIMEEMTTGVILAKNIRFVTHFFGESGTPPLSNGEN
jgi:hypothetical protein